MGWRDLDRSADHADAVSAAAPFGSSFACLKEAAVPNRIKDFLASGEHKEFWWYYCIATFDSPNAHPMPWLNPTPVEWPRLHGRLLHWLAAQWGIRGML